MKSEFIFKLQGGEGMPDGYKTRQRERILQFLTENRDRHLSAEDVAAHLRAQQLPVGRTTVYRTLDQLVEQGAVRRYYLGEGAGACYQFTGREDCHEHFHLKCTGCGRLIHVECDYLGEVSKHVLEHHQFTIDNTKTVLYGLCADCAAKNQGEPK